MIIAKGYAAQDPQADLAPWEFQLRDLGPHDVQLRIMYCGVCHTDLHQIRNDWYPGIFPMVPGHEIVGEIISVGAHVKKFTEGDWAGVGTMVDSCGTCKECGHDHENLCTNGAVWTYNSLGKDGLPTYGGYANTMVVHEKFALSVSKNLDPKGVGPLLCAGITTYSPLRRLNVGKGHKLAVLGLGGLGHMAVKFALAFGADVTVLSNSPDKREASFELGAHHFIDMSNASDADAVKGTFDFIIDCVSAPHGLNLYLGLLATGGTHICVGIPVEPFSLSPFSLLAGNKSVTGSGSGGLLETQEMLDFCAEHNITADVELINAKDIHAAFERMVRGDVRYRFVIDLNTL
ncbi:NAD(P)-dependent alcohol dehydrogenase [Dyadobacter luticola]|uniref:NAD(P)-dependent alcohol dehydrogenase n=1 Tax=Dyadobacter luticola TaxID=1979387 RepID=A0A5R9L6E6_9BACT|nr:NAD(P)-dependent alcohol dehydrogenase [Dyadobacter luticola]TLV03815.1 NAD(P)-dependent alcohol dehydrogenase [Dyadobacter luticola]